MVLRNAAELLGITREEIQLEVRGDRFFINDKELSGADLEEISQKCNKMIFINYKVQ